MKINEVEQALGVSKANIRFYEKQNLLSPRRSENGYRDYSAEDIDRLQNIIILRKLGISVQDIECILNGDISLQNAISNNIKELEDQIEELQGALELSQQIASENASTLDTQRYWKLIQEKESQGIEFVDIVSDYWMAVLQPTVFRRFGLSKNMSIKRILLQIVLICAIFSAVRTFVWKDGDLISNFFYWPLIILVGTIIVFPIFWLGKHHPKAASVISTILVVLCALFVATMIVILILGLLGLLA